MLIKNVPHNQVLDMAKVLTAGKGQVSNLTLVARPDLTLCFMTVAAGEKISAHSAPGDALAHILSGEAEITVGETVHRLKAGQAIVMPQGVPHSLSTQEGFSMILTLVKEPA